MINPKRKDFRTSTVAGANGVIEKFAYSVTIWKSSKFSNALKWRFRLSVGQKVLNL